jgi:alpha-tubulin suppressor-like RCC1 family protein
MMRVETGGMVIGPLAIAAALALPSSFGGCVAFKTSEDVDDAGASLDGSVPNDGASDASSEEGLDAGLQYTDGPCVRQIAAGDFHTCALLADDTVRCWGINASGELGQPPSGFERKYTKPTEVPGLTKVAEIACGGVAGFGHTCARTKGGRVLCWGQNKLFELGRSGVDATPDPAAVEGVQDAVALSTRGAHVCAAISDGGVVCWGMNGSGELGRTPVFDGGALLPGAVQGLPSAVSAVAAGVGHTCVIPADRSLSCFGWNATGQLGSPNPKTYRVDPQQVPGEASIGQVFSGVGFTCALRTEIGDVSCWGYNKDGELGNGTISDQDSHKRVHLPTGRKAVRLGGSSLAPCALLDDGSLWCWGANTFGQVGASTGAGIAISTPVPVSGLHGAKILDIVGGASHACALFDDGIVSCWGSNLWGELGRGDTTPDGGPDEAPHPLPVDVDF